MDRIVITPSIAIDGEELTEKFIRASGPGGQNVNKVSTAVELRFDLMGSPSLPMEVKERAARIAGRKVSASGVLIIKAQTARTQDANREIARQALIAILEAAAYPPKRRIATRVPKSQKTARRDDKAIRSRIKSGRGRIGPHD